jgi:hypothetical protein
MAPNRIATLALAGVSTLAACGLVGTSPQPSRPQSCKGISAELGGCDNPPQYEGTTCAALATEWGTQVNDRVVAIIEGPAIVADVARSARILRTQVLATVTLPRHMDEIGLLGECSAAQILTGALPEFDAEHRAGIGTALYDGSPVATWEQYMTETEKSLSILDYPVST